jgi:solute carrier family 25 (adenine nucleotide translocator) protein 4/5/6/31
MLSNEGPGGFFKGNLSNVYRSVGSSLVLVLYDEFKAWAAKIAH